MKRWMLLAVPLGASVPCACADPEPAPEPERAAILLTLHEVTPQGLGDRVADVDACITQGADEACEVTDGGGQVAFEVVAGEPLKFSANKHDYMTSIVHMIAPAFDTVFDANLVHENTSAALSALVGVDFPWVDTGVLSVLGAPGVTFSVLPDAGTAPIYFDADGIPDPALDAMTSQGSGFVGELPPGEYEVTLSGCSGIAVGLPADAPNAARTFVEADALTFLGGDCP